MLNRMGMMRTACAALCPLEAPGQPACVLMEPHPKLCSIASRTRMAGLLGPKPLCLGWVLNSSSVFGLVSTDPLQRAAWKVNWCVVT